MSGATERELHSLQLSHEELLLLLGIARLPMPLALGEQPLDGHSEATLGAALASASGSLIARGVLIPSPERGLEQPSIAGGVEPLLADLALADRCLIAVARSGNRIVPTAYTVRGRAVLAHTRPLERVHHLERLPAVASIVEQLHQQLAVPTPAGAPLDFVVDADALLLAVESLASGRSQNAASILQSAGVDAEVVAVFLQRAASSLAQVALLQFEQLQSGKPSLASYVLLKGSAEVWSVEDTDNPARVHVQTLNQPALQALLQRATSKPA